MEDVLLLRRFNRSYAQRIGVLAESYLGTGRSLGPSRLLFEIGADGAVVADLRRRLGLDSGYLSRLLRTLEADGLVTVAEDAVDGRRRVVRLTAAGRREWRRLDRRSDQVVERLIASLTPRQRAELVAALETAERLLGIGAASFEIVDPRSAVARSAVGRYFAELDARFPAGFDPEAGGAERDAAAMRAPSGAFVVVLLDGQVIGCGGVQRIDEHTAEIKRMWIDAGWRGSGLGRRLLTRLEEVAGELGHTRVVLDTNATLTEAIAMYERAGYAAIERYNDNPYAHRWFEKSLDAWSELDRR